MTTCPNNIWNHTDGCTCVANGRAAAESAVTLDGRDEAWMIDHDRAHDHADNLVSGMSDDEKRAFLAAYHVTDIPTDPDDLDERARDLAHETAADAVNGNEVDWFINDYKPLPEQGGFPELTPEQGYQMNRRQAVEDLAAYRENPESPDAYSLSFSALATLSTLREIDDEKVSDAADMLDLALRVENQRVLSDYFDRALAALKESGAPHDSGLPVAVDYRRVSDAVNHANRRLDHDIAAGRVRPSEMSQADAKRLVADSLTEALAAADDYYARRR